MQEGGEGGTGGGGGEAARCPEEEARRAPLHLPSSLPPPIPLPLPIPLLKKTLLPYLASQKCFFRYLAQKSPKLMRTQSSSDCQKASQKIQSRQRSHIIGVISFSSIFTVDTSFEKHYSCNLRENQPNPVCSK